MKSVNNTNPSTRGRLTSFVVAALACLTLGVTSAKAADRPVLVAVEGVTENAVVGGELKLNAIVTGDVSKVRFTILDSNGKREVITRKQPPFAPVVTSGNQVGGWDTTLKPEGNVAMNVRVYMRNRVVDRQVVRFVIDHDAPAPSSTASVVYHSNLLDDAPVASTPTESDSTAETSDPVEPEAPAVTLATRATFDTDAPVSHTIGEATEFNFDINGELINDDFVLALAWSQSEKRMVNAFAHTFMQGPFRLDNAKLDLLPVGKAELQLIVSREGRTVSKTTRLIQVLPKVVPATEVAFDSSSLAQHELGQIHSIGFNINGEMLAGDTIVAKAWSQANDSAVDGFNFTFNTAPGSINSEQLDLLTVGGNELRLSLVRNGEVIHKATHWVEVTSPVQPAQTATFVANTPTSHTLGKSTQFNFAIDGELINDDFVIALAWSDSEQRMVDEFAHIFKEGPFHLDVDKLNLLPVGNVELQLIVNRSGGAVSKTTHKIEVLPQIVLATEVSLASNTITQHEVGQTNSITYDVNGDLMATDDILVMVWSEALNATVNDFTHTVTSSPGTITAAQLDALPVGRNQLQIMLRRNDEVVHKITHWVEVTTPARPATSVAFSPDTPTNLTLGETVDIGFTVDGQLVEGYDVLVIAWSDSESRMVGSFAHSVKAKPYVITAEQLNLLPAGRVNLQLLLRKDYAAIAKVDKWVTFDLPSGTGETDTDTPDDGTSEDPASEDPADGGDTTTDPEPEPEPTDTYDVALNFDSDNPTSYTIDSGTPILVLLDGTVPSDATLQITARDSVQQTVEDFTHTIGLDVEEINNNKIDALVAGQYMLVANLIRNGEVLVSAYHPLTVKAAPITDSVTGWTKLEPHVGAKVVYVSSSQGDDNNSGLSSSDPVKTIARAGQLGPNWILLKCGDVWKELPYIRDGASEDKPFVFASYGSGARPVLKTGTTTPLNSKINHVRIVGIDFYADRRDPANGSVSTTSASGIRLRGSSDVLIEGCRIRFYSTNIVLINYSTTPCRDIRVRRNVIQNAWSNSSHAQGMYSENGLNILIEENVFDSNGFLPGVANKTIFNHNMYLHSGDGMVVRGNLVANASSFGIKFSTHTDPAKGNQRNVLCENNVFFANTNTISTGGHADEWTNTGLTIRNNVFSQSGGVIDGRKQCMGVSLKSVNGGLVEDNYFIDKPYSEAQGFCVLVESNPHKNVVVRNNIAYRWWMKDASDGFIANREGSTSQNNEIITDGSAFVDPSRTIETYAAEELSLIDGQDLVRQAVKMNYLGWRNDLAAETIVDYVRAGFERIPSYD